MSRAAARFLRLPVAWGMLFGLAIVGPVAARATVASPAGFETTRSVQQSLKRMQELWLQWLGASLQENPAKAAETLRSLQATARQIGFSRLPDLASGAAARALQSAGEGEFARARREIEAAETLDPGRPDVAFVAARIARGQGAWSRAASSAFEAFRRLLSPPHRGPVVLRAQLWVLLASILAAALFVLVQAATKGGALYGDFSAALGRHVPDPVAHALAISVLVGPLLVPGGPVWLLLLWSALLWGYGSRSERAAFLGVWLLAALAPTATASLERKMVLDVSPPIRALERFAQGSLAGSLFSDLQVLRSALPDDPAVLELVADVHRTLGQWEIARALYRQVLGEREDVTSALINLGAYAFRKGDFASASGYFQRAAANEPPSAAAWYNLSLAYSESYQFDESQSALSRAREIDGARVDRWIQTPNPDRVLTFNGGLARDAEIESHLEAAWTESGEEAAARRRLAVRQAPMAVLATALLAVILHLVRRRWGYGEPEGWLDPSQSAIGRWLRALLPAVSHAERGEGGSALLNLAGLAALLTLPRFADLGGDFLHSGPLRTTTTAIAFSGLALYLALRVRRELSGERG